MTDHIGERETKHATIRAHANPDCVWCKGHGTYLQAGWKVDPCSCAMRGYHRAQLATNQNSKDAASYQALEQKSAAAAQRSVRRTRQKTGK